ncbi:hypothetical protein GCM10007933_06160 [Zoogloea oryzae]|uniref:UmuC domain-containing protein n=1 Tax=Zoogloea oryzae TaxID=310767 RepID=A0ABQ6F7D9_9RHOO|nr:DNA polymerase Y family protein [Zoogloea oryzae]GLT21164.1 hypothetical protein GCM10007933_06160 [Zoogloea oryzae]
MLWCALYLPDLPLQVFARGQAETGPLAVLSPRPRQRVLAATPAAQACGIEAGLKRASALALLPSLTLIDRDIARETAALAEIAGWAGRFTSSVSLDPPATLQLEIRASLRLFGGLDPACAAITDGLTELGFTALLAVAPTPLAARWLARCAPGSQITDPAKLPETLDALPLGTLADEPGLSADTLELLTGIGARCLGDVRRLPRSGLARRQAQAITDLLDRAYGATPDPRRWYVAPEHYTASLPLPAPSDQVDTLLFAVRRLLGGLGGWLDGRQAGLERFSLVLEFEALTSAHRGLAREARLDIVLGTLTRDMARCQLLAREHLSRQALPAPVDTVRIEADAPCPIAPPRSDLFDAKAGEDGDPDLLVATLRARLGHEAVRCLATHPDHRPELAWRRVDPLARPRASAASDALPSAPRPLWLLAEPRPIQQPAAENLLAGPERIESGWWDGDDAEIARDYYVARRRDRSLVWVFRDRRPPHGWFLHGYFA